MDGSPRTPKTPLRTRATTKTYAAGVIKNPLQIDDATLGAMMFDLENFGNIGYAQALPEEYYLSKEHDENISSRTESRKESIIEWFDRNVEKELFKRKDKEPLIKHKKPIEVDEENETDGQRTTLSPGPMMRNLAEARGSGIDIVGQLMQEPDSDLLDAVEKFAKAEAICKFAGAVEAAEEAAKAVPPDQAEEAAAAGARGYESEITKIVKQIIPGEHPIELVGYIGITRPRHPKKS